MYGGRPGVTLLPLHLTRSAQQLQQHEQQQNREGPLAAYTHDAGTYGPPYGSGTLATTGCSRKKTQLQSKGRQRKKNRSKRKMRQRGE
jgi:hypothetical protein